MDLDPIVLLAYMSVAINLLTLAAAVVAYSIFRARRERQRARRAKAGTAATAATPEPFVPVFLRPYLPSASGTPFAALAAPGPADSALRG
jgi:hypothetical protein